MNEFYKENRIIILEQIKHLMVLLHVLSNILVVRLIFFMGRHILSEMNNE